MNPRASTPVGVHRGMTLVHNGNVEFGRPEAQGQQENNQNINGWWWQGTSPGTANTDFAVPHKLGRVPTGYDVKKINAPSHVYTGATSWTSTVIYLRTDQPSVTLTLFIH